MKKIDEMLNTFDNWLKTPNDTMYPSDIAYLLKNLEKEDEKLFLYYIELIPKEYLGEILLELPKNLRKQVIDYLNIDELTLAIEELESDDATDLVQDIEVLDKNKFDTVVANLSEEDRKDINKLIEYEENESGAFMQTELFQANIKDTIRTSISKLKILKDKGELENIHQVFIVDDSKRLIASIPLEDLIIMDFNSKFIDVLKDSYYKPKSVKDTEKVEVLAKIFEQYNLSVIAVVDWQGVLLGRITSDDIYDVIQEIATEQIYNMAGLDEEIETNESLKEIAKKRSAWLFLNLITAILSSFVIAIFDDTLKAYITLAILMPIVASMGGNAGTQTLAVIIRQLTLGEIDFENAKYAIKKEVFVSLINGFIFALLIGLISYFWFKNLNLGFVIAIAMVVNIFFAGFMGALIPITFKKIGVDPTISSTVILTTVTDILGFFTFLGLAKIIIL